MKGSSTKATPKATPKAKKVKDSNKKLKETKKASNVLEFKENEETVTREQVSVALSALSKCVESAKSTAKSDLFEDQGQRVNIQITAIKLPKDNRQQLVNVVLPHAPQNEPSVCLIVKDLVKGLKDDHEETVQHYKELLQDNGVTSEVTQVMSLRELKVEYKPFETKTKLCHTYDKFIVDDRIIRLVPKLLGKPFYKRKKFPVPVKLSPPQHLAREISKCVRTSILPLSHHGVCSMVQVGHTQMDKAHLQENILAAIEVIKKRYPGGWKNIRSIHVKAEASLAVPLHFSTISGNDVGFVDADIPARLTKKSVTDELSTRPGMEVTVTPEGRVKITKKADPEWDNEKDEPFVEDSEEEKEDEDEEDNEEEEAKKKKQKKRKNEEKKEKVKSKKTKKEEKEDEEEDDEELEMKYMEKVAKEEEEMERKEQMKGKTEADKEADSNLEDEEESDEEEGEEEESDFDDEDELDENDVVVDSDEEDEEEEEEDEDEALMRKKNVNQSDSE